MATSTFTQINRPLSLQSPLGKDALLLIGFQGRESISHLFHFRLTVLAEHFVEVPFEKLLGQPVLVELALAQVPGKRFFHGIISRVSQGESTAEFTTYALDVVPRLWLLTRRVQNRVFQKLTAPEVLKKVLDGLEVAYELAGPFPARDYCVQYQESDFHFASRLMEEEGIYYFFRHSDRGHQLVLANTPKSHPDVPGAKEISYEKVLDGRREEDRVLGWQKSQTLCSGKVTVWDHCFEMPEKNLEAVKVISDTVEVGKVVHHLRVAGNEKLEVYRFPGGYAEHYDGVEKGGGDQSGDLHKIFEENERTAQLLMQEQAAASLAIRGRGNCRKFTAGHKFTLIRHPDADGAYVLTSVEHHARLANLRSGIGRGDFEYKNHFTCLPLALPFRPRRRTARPVIHGTQTAVVVGPAGEKIFTDKYGRVKVQFHWDRHGKKDTGSSCWVRVSQNWGGGRWGGIFIPHVGQEVLVNFEEGDPDRPVITGRVYNAAMMPPRALPGNKTQSNISDHGGNYLLMEGAKGKQLVDLYSPTGNTHLTLGKNVTAGATHHMPNFQLFTTAEGETCNSQEGFTLTTEGFGYLEVDKDLHASINQLSDWFVGGNWDRRVVGWFKDVVAGPYYYLEVSTGNYTLNVPKGFYKATVMGNYGIEVTDKDYVLLVDKGNARTRVATDIKEAAGRDIAMWAGNNVDIGAGQDIMIHAKKHTYVKGHGNWSWITGGWHKHVVAGIRTGVTIGPSISLMAGGAVSTVGPIKQDIIKGMQSKRIHGAKLEKITGLEDKQGGMCIEKWISTKIEKAKRYKQKAKIAQLCGVLKLISGIS
jgi:type VI secretion system secreted protein VgrG